MATALASNVFPVPGGPYSRTPETIIYSHLKSEVVPKNDRAHVNGFNVCTKILPHGALPCCSQLAGKEYFL